ncbi:MAG: sulfite exporter TauE/SafE family protein [Anaerolineae bacterium]
MFKPLFFIAMVIVGYLAQFVDGTLGMGYGVFSASLLVSIGLYPVIASASVHTAEVFTTLLSGAFHFRFGNVKRDLVLSLAIPGVIGGVAGAYFLASVPGKTIKPFVAVILLMMGLLILYRFLVKKNPITPENNGHSRGKLTLLGLVAGFMDAVGGGGWGPIATPSLILAGSDEPRQVVGSINLVEFFVTVAETLTFLIIVGPEAFRWDIVVALLIGGAIAAPTAAFLCKKLPAKALGSLIGVALVGLNVRTLLSLVM